MRIPRFLQITDGDTLHVYWRCTDHENQYLLDQDKSKDHFLALLLKNKKRFGILVYDYALMDNHEHLLLKIRSVKAFSRFLQCLNTAFAKHINKVKRRSGAVVKDRCKVSVIPKDEKWSLIASQAYLELNRWVCAANTPPEQYRHCGYGFYALGQANELIDPSPEWLEMGEDNEERQAAFKKLVQAKMDKTEQTRAEIEALDKPPRYLGKNAKALTKQLYANMRTHYKDLRAAYISLDFVEQSPAGSDREKI